MPATRKLVLTSQGEPNVPWTPGAHRRLLRVLRDMGWLASTFRLAPESIRTEINDAALVVMNAGHPRCGGLRATVLTTDGMIQVDVESRPNGDLVAVLARGGMGIIVRPTGLTKKPRVLRQYAMRGRPRTVLIKDARDLKREIDRYMRD